MKTCNLLRFQGMLTKSASSPSHSLIPLQVGPVILSIQFMRDDRADECIHRDQYYEVLICTDAPQEALQILNDHRVIFTDDLFAPRCVRCDEIQCALSRLEDLYNESCRLASIHWR